MCNFFFSENLCEIKVVLWVNLLKLLMRYLFSSFDNYQSFRKAPSFSENIIEFVLLFFSFVTVHEIWLTSFWVRFSPLISIKQGTKVTPNLRSLKHNDLDKTKWRRSVPKTWYRHIYFPRPWFPKNREKRFYVSVWAQLLLVAQRANLPFPYRKL